MPALTSPGVAVTIIDESQYLPAAPSSIPLVILASAENKADPTSTGIAQATTAANAGKMFRITSQRDLVTLYGNPFFYSTAAGTSIQGYELNEYGLLAAYSALGISNQVFCLRADIDLASLVGSTGRPTGAPADGAFWVDTTTSTWGINEFNATTGTFTPKSPIVITDLAQLSGGTASGAPLASVGGIGDYCVKALFNYDAPTAPTAPQYFFKDYTNSWQPIGSTTWMDSWVTLQGTEANPAVSGGEFAISLSGRSAANITVAGSAPMSQIVQSVNDLGFGWLSARDVDGKLALYSNQTGGNMEPVTGNSDGYFLELTTVSGTILTELGFSEGQKSAQPKLQYGTSAEQPLWQAGQTEPRPTGSVWIKVGGTGGLNPVVSEYNLATANWVPKTLSFAADDWSQINSNDLSGGQSIPAGSVYAQYGFDDNNFSDGPVYLWNRIATGPTVITGTNTASDFTSGPYESFIWVTGPNPGTTSGPYTINLGNATDATDFVTAWSAAGIPNTSAVVNDDGSLSISHLLGGVIFVDDINVSSGLSNGLMTEAGFVAGTTTGCKYGAFTQTSFQPVQGSTTGSGVDFIPNVRNDYTFYDFNPITFTNAGTGYVEGDEIVILGTALGGTTPENDLTLKVVEANAGAVVSVTYVSGTGAESYAIELSNWQAFSTTTTGANSLTSNEGAPVAIPANLTNWFYSATDQVDIMINFEGSWKGYGNQGYDSNGMPLPASVNTTDPMGPIVSASTPTLQSDGTPLVYGDLWIDSSDLENYPIISRWQSVSNIDRWVLIDNGDQTSPQGVLFADARWALNGTINPADDPMSSIKALLASDYLDVDAPASTLSPTGMLLFNSRRSGYNVKQFRVNYFNADRFPAPAVIPQQTDAWVTASGLQADGAPYMGRKAQRAMVVKSMKSAIDSNTAIRDEDNFFNLQATPNYPELQPNMIALNADRGETSYIIGDTPMRLKDDATEIQAWATNAAGATGTGEDGLVTRNTYMGLFYPSGITNDLSGNEVAVPSSHMMIRTMLRNDDIAYPWLAPAGTRRGLIDNASSIGYLDDEGEFEVIKTRIGIRDVLYSNFINPMVFFTGNGLLNYGNKTSFNSSSALDRINVARLVAYIRRQLVIAARPFVFEPNDAQTRGNITAVVTTLFQDLISKRGVYDYSVVCDTSNNTPARIDRNELWIDIAVEPVKAAEFIYIPVRIFNTGELSGN